MTENEVWNYVNVNMASLLMMTHIILTQMEKRGKGAIINVGSVVSYHPIPLANLYSASKVGNF